MLKRLIYISGSKIKLHKGMGLVSDVFKAEEILNGKSVECKVVPTPVQDKAYCGVCIETQDEQAKVFVVDMEFEVLE